ncbi:hypothetical protein [Lactococcus protaetiae]|uniref:GLUG domain-containing protein n=1 Tax=Lactococcus protaetiae TaxID=2592653 RepID=A0A514Z8N9_9LACT|nr:hypothetical protein [Lactococcus protaetiae]QDK70951.1 hypothetical protein FLP15_07000 [Lactococcus protaetiae]
MSQSMNKKSVLSMILLSTLILSQAAPVFATVQEEITEPNTELVTETPTVETESNAEAPPTEENSELEDNSEMLQKIAEANLTQVTEETFAITPSEDTIFDGGNGTVENPYLISTAEQLDRIRDDLGAHYELTADIDLSAYSNWTPIGGTIEDPYKEFMGSLNGNNHSISNLLISNALYTGLFRMTGSTADIRNISLNAVDISGMTWVGGIAGRNSGTINNVIITGNISGSNVIGGVTGSNSGGTISHSRVDVNIAANYSPSNAGGIAGQNSSSASIISSYSLGKVTGLGTVGGLIGSNNGNVENCYSLTDVEGITNVGGLIGYSAGKVSSNYAAGDVTRVGSNDTGRFGGLIGSTSFSAIMNNVAVGKTINAQSVPYVNAVLGLIEGHLILEIIIVM